MPAQDLGASRASAWLPACWFLPPALKPQWPTALSLPRARSTLVLGICPLCPVAGLLGHRPVRGPFMSPQSQFKRFLLRQTALDQRICTSLRWPCSSTFHSRFDVLFTAVSQGPPSRAEDIAEGLTGDTQVGPRPPARRLGALLQRVWWPATPRPGRAQRVHG